MKRFTVHGSQFAVHGCTSASIVLVLVVVLVLERLRASKFGVESIWWTGLDGFCPAGTE
jgi:hypothetical protein